MKFFSRILEAWIVMGITIGIIWIGGLEGHPKQHLNQPSNRVASYEMGQEYKLLGMIQVECYPKGRRHMLDYKKMKITDEGELHVEDPSRKCMSMVKELKEVKVIIRIGLWPVLMNVMDLIDERMDLELNFIPESRFFPQVTKLFLNMVELSLWDAEAIGGLMVKGRRLEAVKFYGNATETSWEKYEAMFPLGVPVTTKLTSVQITSFPTSDAVALRIMKFFRQQESPLLKEFVLHNAQYTSPVVTELLGFLVHCQQLEKLSLMGYSFDEPLGPKFMIIAHGLHRIPKLKSLQIMDDTIDDVSMREFTKYLTSRKCTVEEVSFETVQHLDPLFNGISQAKWVGIKKLVIAYAETVTNDHVKKLALAMKQRRILLKHLDLGFNSIDQGGAFALGDAIHDYGLESLILAGNPIGNLGVFHISSGLSLLKPLKKLDIHAIQYSVHGPIFRKLAKCTEYLRISMNNTSMYYKGRIAEALLDEEIKLKTLEVVGDSSLLAIAFEDVVASNRLKLKSLVFYGVDVHLSMIRTFMEKSRLEELRYSRVVISKKTTEESLKLGYYHMRTLYSHDSLDSLNTLWTEMDNEEKVDYLRKYTLPSINEYIETWNMHRLVALFLQPNFPWKRVVSQMNIFQMLMDASLTKYHETDPSRTSFFELLTFLDKKRPDLRKEKCSDGSYLWQYAQKRGMNESVVEILRLKKKRNMKKIFSMTKTKDEKKRKQYYEQEQDEWSKISEESSGLGSGYGTDESIIVSEGRRSVDSDTTVTQETSRMMNVDEDEEGDLDTEASNANVDPFEDETIDMAVQVIDDDGEDHIINNESLDELSSMAVAGYSELESPTISSSSGSSYFKDSIIESCRTPCVSPTVSDDELNKPPAVPVMVKKGKGEKPLPPPPPLSDTDSSSASQSYVSSLSTFPSQSSRTSISLLKTEPFFTKDKKDAKQETVLRKVTEKRNATQETTLVERSKVPVPKRQVVEPARPVIANDTKVAMTKEAVAKEAIKAKEIKEKEEKKQDEPKKEELPVNKIQQQVQEEVKEQAKEEAPIQQNVAPDQNEQSANYYAYSSQQEGTSDQATSIPSYRSSYIDSAHHQQQYYYPNTQYPPAGHSTYAPTHYAPPYYPPANMNPQHQHQHQQRPYPPYIYPAQTQMVHVQVLLVHENGTHYILNSPFLYSYQATGFAQPPMPPQFQGVVVSQSKKYLRFMDAFHRPFLVPTLF